MRKILEELKRYSLIINKFYRIRVMGSTALSLCQIAKGSVDAFVDLVENSRLVDTAAGMLILREAGGKIFSKDGNNFNAKLSIDSKFPFVASNAKLEVFLKENLNKIALNR
jgi:fructose-1,6-bisphosphatase/inositol monophosphatase family enzyme